MARDEGTGSGITPENYPTRLTSKPKPKKKKRITVKRPARVASAAPVRRIPDAADAARRKPEVDREMRRNERLRKQREEIQRKMREAGGGGFDLGDEIRNAVGDVGRAGGALALQVPQLSGPGAGRRVQSKRKRQETSKRLLEDNWARDWLIGSGLSQQMETGKFNAMSPIDAMFLGLPFLRPVAGTRAGVAGAWAARRGLREGAEAAGREFAGPGLTRRGARAAKGRLLKPWGEKMLDVAEPAARSRTGRAIEDLADTARPVTGKIPGIRSQGQKLGSQVERRLKFERQMESGPATALGRVARKLSRSQKYAIKLVAEGATPESRISFHMSRAAASKNPATRGRHLILADLYRAASKYVVPDEEGLRLADDAPKRLKEAWELTLGSNETRERIYQDLGLLTDEQIEARIQKPAEMLRSETGARWQRPWLKELEELQQSPERAKLEAAVRESLGEEAGDDFMATVDFQALAMKQETEQRLTARVDELKAKIEAGTATDEEKRAALVLSTYLKQDIPQDLYYSQLGDAAVGFPEAVKESYRKRYPNMEFRAEMDELKPGFVRLYRGEQSGRGKKGFVGHPRGRWFTTDKDQALQYAQTRNDLKYVDVPEDVAREAMRGVLRYPDNVGEFHPRRSAEFVLPREWAGRAKAVPLEDPNMEFRATAPAGVDSARIAQEALDSGKTGKPRTVDIEAVEQMLTEQVDSPLAQEYDRLADAAREATEPNLDEIFGLAPEGFRERGILRSPEAAGTEGVGDLVRRGGESDLGRGPDGLDASEDLGNLLHGVHGVARTPKRAKAAGVELGQSVVYVSENTPVPLRTWTHELKGHYTDRQWLTDEQRAVVDQYLGNDAEDFAYAWEEWLMSVAEGREPNVPAELKPALQRLSEKALEETAGTDALAAGRTYLPDQIADLIDSLHQFTPHRGPGKAYIPAKRGLPTNWRKPLRQVNAHMRAASSFLSGNRKAPIGRGATDASTVKEWKGLLMEMGMEHGDVTKATAEQAFKAVRVGSVAKARRYFLRASTELPQNVDDIPIKVDPTIDSPRDLRRLLDMMEDMELDPKRVSTKQMNELDLDVFEQITDSVFPSQVNGKPAAGLAWEMVNTAAQEPIENIRWVSREMVEASHVMNSPRALVAQQEGWGKAEHLGTALDAYNDIVKASLLQLNPAYYSMNFLGNVALNLMQQGPFAILNIPKAARMSALLGERHAALIDDLMGAGLTQLSEFRLPHTYALNALNRAATKLVDTVPRRAAFLHEARRVGIKSSDDLKQLLEAGMAGDEGARDLLFHIKEKANRAIIDYENLNPFEKKVVSRVIFIYPWIKGSTSYAVRFPKEHPIQAMAFALLYQRQQEMADEELGGRPWYADLSIPIGTVDRFGEEYPLTLNPKQLVPFSQQYDIAKSLYGFGTGDVTQGAALADMTSPLISNAITTLAGHRAFDDRDVPRSAGTFIDETLSVPWRDRVEALQTSDAERADAAGNKLYPRNFQDELLKVGLGSLAPTPYNPEKGYWLGHGEREPWNIRRASENLEMIEAELGPAPEKIRSVPETKREYEVIKLEARRHAGGDLTDEQLAKLKFGLLLKIHPEFAQYQASAFKAFGDPARISSADAKTEDLLGWTDFSNLVERVNAARKRRGEGE